MEKRVLRVAFLLFVGATIMTVSAGEDDSDSGSDSEETTTQKGEAMMMKTTSGPMSSDTKAIEKLIVGSFRMTSDPKADDFEDLLKAMEFKKEDRKKIRSVPNIDLTLTKVDRMKYKIVVTAGPIKFDTTFKIGKEFKDKLFDGRNFKGTINFEGNNKLVKKEKHLGFDCTHVSTYTSKGFTIDLECKGVKASQEFKRMKTKQGGGGVSLKLGK